MARRPFGRGPLPGGRGPNLPLVERGAELGALAAAVEAARGGAGAAVLIEAAAGLGKSRLMAEAGKLAVGGGVRVLRARSVQSERKSRSA